MEIFVWITLLIIYSLIDISNIVTNIFIIYALRKLGKLGNVSYWLICCLSISDCFVGLSGFACHLYTICCILGSPCLLIKYVYEVMTFFLSYSGRLTTIIAIDRSIRMKFLTRYSAVMTRTKANSALLFNAILGLVYFAGKCSSLHRIFDLVYIIFHFICITSSCTFYLFTYYSIKQQVADLNLNLRRNHHAPIKVIGMHPSVSYYSSKCQRQESDGGIKPAGGNHVGGECHSVGNADTLSRSPVRDNIKHCLTVPDKVHAKIDKNHMKEIPERSIDKSPPNDTIAKELSVTFCNRIHFNDDDQGTVAHAQHTTKTTAKDSREVTNLKRTESDVGKAMIVITLAMIFCYMPIFVKGFLEFCNVDSGDLLGAVSMLLLIANSSLNAIILTLFSREIRSLAKSLFRMS